MTRIDTIEDKENSKQAMAYAVGVDGIVWRVMAETPEAASAISRTYTSIQDHSKVSVLSLRDVTVLLNTTEHEFTQGDILKMAEREGLQWYWAGTIAQLSIFKIDSIKGIFAATQDGQNARYLPEFTFSNLPYFVDTWSGDSRLTTIEILSQLIDRHAHAKQSWAEFGIQSSHRIEHTHEIINSDGKVAYVYANPFCNEYEVGISGPRIYFKDLYDSTDNGNGPLIKIDQIDHVLAHYNLKLPPHISNELGKYEAQFEQAQNEKTKTRYVFVAKPSPNVTEMGDDHTGYVQPNDELVKVLQQIMNAKSLDAAKEIAREGLEAIRN